MDDNQSMAFDNRGKWKVGDYDGMNIRVECSI